MCCSIRQNLAEMHVIVVYQTLQVCCAKDLQFYDLIGTCILEAPQTEGLLGLGVSEFGLQVKVGASSYEPWISLPMVPP